MIVVCLIIALSLVEYFGDSNFKAYARSGKNLHLIYGLVFYSIMIKLLIESLKKGNLIYVNGMWDGISTIIGTVLAYYLLKETLSTPLQWCGMVLIILGVFTLNIGKIPI